MIFVVNELGEGMNMSLDVMNGQEEEKVTYLSANISGTEENAEHTVVELFCTRDEAVTAAINKRFKSGTSNLKCVVNRHDFFLSNSLTVAKEIEAYTDGTCCTVLTSVPINLADRTEEEKKLSRNAIVVVTKESDKLEVGMNDDRNILVNTSFVSGGYKFSMIIVKWSSWKSLRHRATIVIKNEKGEVRKMLELGTSTSASGRTQDDLVVMTADDIKKFQEQEAAEVEAKKKAAEERRIKNPKQVRENQDGNRPYQNRRPNGNNYGYGNRRTGTSENRYGNRDNNQRGGYRGNANNDNRNQRFGNRRNNGNGQFSGGYRQTGDYKGRSGGYAQNNGHRRFQNESR